MITLTAPDGSQVSIDAKLVLRARRTISGENSDENEGAQTRIDWAIMSLVRESISQASALIKVDLPSFTALTGRDGSEIWFNAKLAVGPLPITPSQRTGGIKSSIKIMGYRQFVSEAPEQVRAVIRAAGGTPL